MVHYSTFAILQRILHLNNNELRLKRYYSMNTRRTFYKKYNTLP